MKFEVYPTPKKKEKKEKQNSSLQPVRVNKEK